MCIRFTDSDLHCTSAIACIYLALLIWAGLDGIQNEIDLPEKANVNLYTAEPRETEDMQTLPLSLGAATKRAEESEFIRAHLPQSLIGCYRHH